MEQISFNLDRYTKPKKLAHTEWQDFASTVADFLKAGKKRSVIFKCVREDRSKSQAIYSYMKEKNIQNVFYFLKVWNDTI